MSKDQPWYVAAGGGALVGLLLGLIIGSVGGDEEEKLEDRLTALEESIAAKLEEGKQSTETAIAKLSEGNSALGASVAEVNTAIKDVHGVVSEVGTKLADGFEEIGHKAAILGDGQAAVGSQIDGLTKSLGGGVPVSAESLKSAMAAYHAERHGSHGGHGEGHAAAPKDEVAEPATAAQDEVDPVVAELTVKIGPDGMIVSAGETASVGGGRLYISRVTDQGVNALVVGGDKVELSVYGGSVAVGDCTVVVEGVVDDAAYLRPDC
ncbi:hypothetical protein KHP62_07610 [Rhodobacteraceae bacterium NNCM2]|nr:hypothetical protein [Coraliihabitans acroporae]